VTYVFKVRKWLEEDEFKELLKIADYMGFENGYKLFKLNIEKALRNGYTPIDVRNIIEEYADEENEILDNIEKLFQEYAAVFEWSTSKGVVRIHIPKTLSSMLKDQLRRYGYKYSGIVGDKVVIEILPYYAYDVYKFFKNQFIQVIDANNIFAEKPLVFKPELVNVTLRQYQEEALNKWIENDYRGIIALPTGSGKSIIAIAAIVKTAVRTLIVAYTKEQVFQWRDFILKYTNIPVHMIGLIYGEEKKLAPITITTYQSGFRNINNISPYFGMLVVDEVHHLPAEKFKYIALHTIAKYRMGLSATPTREDGKHEELFPLLGGIIYHKLPSELVEQGFLAPYTIITVKVGLSKQERALYEQLRRKYRALVGSKKFEEVLKEARKGIPRAIEALKIHSEMRQILAKACSKIDKAVEIAKREYEKGNKVIIFTQYVEQAKDIASRLNGLLLTGETPEADRKHSLELFKHSPRGILVVTTVGDEGIDIPDANVGIIVSGTGSRRQFIQRLGRLLRPKTKGTGAVLYEIVLEKTPEELQARKRKTIEPGEFDLDDD